ncbi:MAG TPA: type III polyketide synthase [Geminicoccaceae bacterium]|jgi:predicted naringenin-chalcone synthase|nr:type III polyketide synthase [Geminicoccaceae bacterium]
MPPVYLNRVATAVPTHDVHRKFVEYAPSLLADDRSRRLFQRMADRAQIDHRYSFLEPDPSPAALDRVGFYPRGAFPGTAERMRFYEAHAFRLAGEALHGLDLPALRREVTHLIVTTCTGFYAPGLDLQIVEGFGLSPAVERTMVGFMGCQAALPALKLAAHVVRSRPEARVLTLSLELCTIHLQETSDLQSVLSFLIFADGCAASLVSAEPVGLEIGGFRSAVLPDSRDQISWHIGGSGFLMWLDGAVPGTIARGLSGRIDRLLGGRDPAEVELWAVHPGGRSVLDAAQDALRLDDGALAASRSVLRDYGNMSSPTVMFVLGRILAQGDRGRHGCALAFGPGLTAEAMRFQLHGAAAA